MYRNIIFASTFLVAGISAQSSSTSGTASCSSTLTASYSAPSVANGYVVQLVATGLISPRGIKFDNDGNLLVVEEGVGITALSFSDDGGFCVTVASHDTIITDGTLNHGIELSSDGEILYASNSDKLYSWSYSGAERQVTSDASTLVENMEGTDHTSRTLLLSRAVPGMIVVNRGSFGNIDLEARDIESGHSQVKAFNITGITSPLDFNGDGVLLGWGLRNDVGIAEEPNGGGIWAVENSGDRLNRSGEDIHENNPAEELNFLGFLNGTGSPNQGQNFGYPDCFSAWETDDLPDFQGQTGEQFAPNDQNSTNNDQICGERIAPRLVFDSHMAPLDIKFNSEGTQAWISFHGSWNREEPIGYKLSVVDFANGEPVEPSDSRTAAVDIVSNPDLSACPRACFRPVGLAWDSNGRLFMSSDSTGEIYMVTRAEGTLDSATERPNGTGTTDTSTSTSTGNASAESPSSAASDGTATSAHRIDSMGALAVVLCALAFFL